ncbi:MAG TPA: CHASE2 domain-containing protein [Dongiaceae bacterium]|nr:CHASE2 domain-containing protein [Dongiaceae bacterium]
MKRRVAHALAVAVVAILYLSGALEFLENRLIDARFGLVERDAGDDLVLVAIDAISLQEIGVWPWPRSLHGAALDRLIEAGAARVAFDVDFSSRSTPQEDARLADALRRAGGRAVLPVFKQFGGRSGRLDLVHSEPLPELRERVTIASLNVRPEQDGLIRRAATADYWNDAVVPTLVGLLGAVTGPASIFYIDYGIRPETVTQLSFVDVLKGRFDAAAVASRQVLIGATAIELGDMLPVPRWGIMPGPLVQSLAVESIRQERALMRSPLAVVLGGMLALAFLLGPRFARWTWRRGLVWLAGLMAAAFGLAVLLQTVAPVLLDTTPWMLVAVLCYGTELIGRIDRQEMSLLAQAIVLRRRTALVQRAVFDNAFHGIVATDQDGTIHTFNRAAEHIFGRAAADVLGRNIDTLIIDMDRDAAALSTPLPRRLAAAGEPREIQGRRPTGADFPIEIAVTEMRDGTALTYLAFVRDISGRKHADALAARARQQLGDAIETIPEGFALYDADDRLVLCNRKFRELFGSVGDLLSPGWRFQDIFRAAAEIGQIDEATGRVEAWLGEAIERHRNPQGPFEQRLANGDWLRVSERRLPDGGTVGILTDISDHMTREEALRKAKTEAEVASRAKSEFLAAMSHELRTPLNAVIGFAQVIAIELLGPVGSPKYLDYARDIERSGTHLLNIINDILDISKVEAGKLDLAEEEIDVRELIEGALGLVRQRAMDAGVRLIDEVEPGLPLLFADGRLLKQILINLLSNAVKFTPASGSVTARAVLDADGQLAFSVSDTGIGIAQEDLPRALALFGQVDSSLGRRYEGTGLGLPLVQRFAALHGGHLELRSEPGVGTTATVWMPAERLRGVPLDLQEKQRVVASS